MLKDCLTFDLLSQITAKFQSINDMISGKPYEQHIVSRFYAVENSSSDQADTEVGFRLYHIFRNILLAKELEAIRYCLLA